MDTILKQHKEWILQTWNKIENKISVTSDRIQDRMPYTVRNGKYDDMSSDPYWWTNSFWCGILWLVYKETKQKKYMEYAQKIEEKLDAALYGYDGLHHDVGFMWLLSSVLNYKITRNENSRRRAMLAASVLSSRANIAGGYIRAWNNWGTDNKGWAIIDCMMNIQLLFWASEEIGDPRFRHIAMMHANKTRDYFVREDGSVNHIVVFDENSGEKLDNLRGQGYEVGSSWSRGQAWAVSGFAQSYHWTKEQSYLNTAKKIAHYIIANLAKNDYLPLCDYRQPETSDLLDSSAGAVTACGLIDIAKAVPEAEKALYIYHAVKLLKALEDKCAIWDDSSEAILTNGTTQYHLIPGGKYEVKNGALIYGDYYFVEALSKLKELTVIDR